MNVVVCVKQVPDTSDPDTEVHIDSSGKGVDQSKFSFVINDAITSRWKRLSCSKRSMAGK